MAPRTDPGPRPRLLRTRRTHDPGCRLRRAPARSACGRGRPSGPDHARQPDPERARGRLVAVLTGPAPPAHDEPRQRDGSGRAAGVGCTHRQASGGRGPGGPGPLRVRAEDRRAGGVDPLRGRSFRAGGHPWRRSNRRGRHGQRRPDRRCPRRAGRRRPRGARGPGRDLPATRRVRGAAAPDRGRERRAGRRRSSTEAGCRSTPATPAQGRCARRTPRSPPPADSPGGATSWARSSGQRRRPATRPRSSGWVRSACRSTR